MLWYFSHINFSYYRLFFEVLFIKLLFSIYAKENYQISEIEQKQECLNKILLAVANTKKSRIEPVAIRKETFLSYIIHQNGVEKFT